MKKTLLIIFAFVLAGEVYSQYLPHYSTYTLHPFHINPAYMGSYTEVKGSLLYKKQWVGFDGAPTIKSFDVGIPIMNKKSVLGIDFYDDRIGVNVNQQVSLNYGYKLKVNTNQHLAFGLSFALRMLKSQLAETTTQQYGDPQFSGNSPRMTAPNFKFGLYYYTNTFYAGLAIPNMMHNKLVSDINGDFDTDANFDLGKTHYYLHSGLKKEVGDDFELHPSLLVKYISGSPVQVDLNMDFTFNEIMGVGLSYRTQNTFVALAHYRLNDYILLAYGFNHNFSSLSDIGSNSHEISLIYSIGKKGKFSLDVPRF